MNCLEPAGGASRPAHGPGGDCHRLRGVDPAEPGTGCRASARADSIQPGLQFGSRYPGDPRQLTLHDFLPDERLREVENLHDFAGMLVSTNGRATATAARRFFLSDPCKAAEQPVTRYKTRMIDQGFCFNAGEWNFPDAPLRGLYARNRVYHGVTGMYSFAPWLERIETQMTERPG